jgi:hypothetical protein
VKNYGKNDQKLSKILRKSPGNPPEIPRENPGNSGNFPRGQNGISRLYFGVFRSFFGGKISEKFPEILEIFQNFPKIPKFSGPVNPRKPTFSHLFTAGKSLKKILTQTHSPVFGRH